MIDILTIQKGDLVEYGPYICSESLKDSRYLGLYEGFRYWSPDERPVELWVDLVAINTHSDQPARNGMKIGVRASQITNVTPLQG